MTSGPTADEFQSGRNFKRGGTSADAAASAAKSAALGDRHRLIWSALRKNPRTPDELARDLNMNLNTVRARISDLRRIGWCVASGERRKTDAGKLADVIRALPKRMEPTG